MIKMLWGLYYSQINICISNKSIGQLKKHNLIENATDLPTLTCVSTGEKELPINDRLLIKTAKLNKITKIIYHNYKSNVLPSKLTDNDSAS